MSPHNNIIEVLAGESGPRMRDVGREALGALRGAARRTATLGAILAVGVALPIVAAAVGRSGQRDVTTEFERRQATEVALIDSDAEPRARRGFAANVNDELLRLGPVTASGLLIALEPVSVSPLRTGTSAQQVAIVGVDESTFQVFGAVVRPTPRWSNGACDRREAVVGRKVLRRLGIGVFPEMPTLLDLTGLPVAVVGIIEEAPLMPGLTDSIAVPECIARTLDAAIVSKRLVLRVTPGAADAVAAQAALVARPGDAASLDVSYIPAPTGLRSVIEATTRRTLLLVGFGVSALAVVVVSAASAAAVSQRRNEIGLRRVLGARRRDVFAQISVESLLVGVAGGQIGATLGIAVVIVMSAWGGWVPVIDWYLWLVGPLGGGILGTLAGLGPAHRATRVEPRVALSYE